MLKKHGIPSTSSTSTGIDNLHHVGHLVHDMERGLELYQRLGFQMTSPSLPVISLKKDAPLTPFGAVNSHADFDEHNFVELVMVADDLRQVPASTKLVPLKVPEEAIPRFVEAVNRTIATLKGCLARFEGLHILVLRSPDVDAQALRLSQEGIRHSGVASTQRQSTGQDGSPTEVIRVLEIDDPDNPLPEGRLALAGTPASTGSHPNGAIGLVESVLCVAEAELSDFERRYEKYTNRQARTEGKMRIFELGNSRITIVADTALDAILPGERPLALPAFVAYAVEVRSIHLTRDLLLDSGFSLKTTGSGDLFVSASEALGAAIIFRQANV